jgi:Uma2 family endonuclease
VRMEFALTGLSLPLRIRPSVPMTDDELMAFCAKNDFMAIERDSNGEIVVMSPSGSETGSSNSEIIIELGLWNRSVGRGVVFDSNAGFTLPDGSMRSPDAAWLPLGKWQALSARDKERFAPVCPEFVIELRSPTDSLSELPAKMHMWIRNGALLAWLIDPQEKAVTIYRSGQEPERFEAISQVSGEGPVAGFVLPLDRVFT